MFGKNWIPASAGMSGNGGNVAGMSGRGLAAGIRGRNGRRDLVPQIAPNGIAFLDQPGLPVAIPFLQLLFSANSIFRVFIGFNIDQTMNVIFFNEFGAKTKPVLFHSSTQIIRYTDIERAVTPTRKDVNVIHVDDPRLSSPRRRGPIRRDVSV